MRAVQLKWALPRSDRNRAPPAFCAELSWKLLLAAAKIEQLPERFRRVSDRPSQLGLLPSAPAQAPSR